MTVRIRVLYSDDGFAFRDASEYVHDPRDLVDGRPPAHFLKFERLEARADEIEFDHAPTEQELLEAFPNRATRLKERDDATPDSSSKP